MSWNSSKIKEKNETDQNTEDLLEQEQYSVSGKKRKLTIFDEDNDD